jgi:hypothetical protein
MGGACPLPWWLPTQNRPVRAQPTGVETVGMPKRLGVRTERWWAIAEACNQRVVTLKEREVGCGALQIRSGQVS